MRERNLIERVQDHARERIARVEMVKSNLYIQREVLRRGHVIKAQHQLITLARDSVMVFVDDAPHLNWSHSCRYLLYGSDDGEPYREISARFPPYLVDPPDEFTPFYEPFEWPTDIRMWPFEQELTFTLRFPRGERYAVLFSGASNNRHVNDLEFLCRTLIDIYNFASDHIYVLNYDGTVDYSGWPHPVGDWPGDGTAYRMSVNGQGTKSDLEGVFDDLKTRLSDEDFLLIHTNNHGGHDGMDSYLCAYSGSSYSAHDFAAKMAELPAFGCCVVMMEQCHSGGFNLPILASSPAEKTTVASACQACKSSIGGTYFDPFARDWIAAMAGADPYGAALASDPDTDSSGRVSAHEAFLYADAVKDPYDTPVYSETSAAAGACYLGQRWRWYWPWYKKIVVEGLGHYYSILPRQQFYERLYRELVPGIEEIDQYLDKRAQELEEELGTRLERLIRKAMEGK